MNINLALLKDKARDVDPDLRFMALDDFQKFINDKNITKNARHIELFVPILFELLNDQASEVQNQAIKLFAPMLQYISDDEVFKIIKKLYRQIVATNEKESASSKFTTSIPNMALRTIFNNDTYQFNSTLARQIVDFLVEEIFSKPIDIDLIEILINIFKNLAHVFTVDEIRQLLLKIVALSFETTGISSKRCIAAFEYLLVQLGRTLDSSPDVYLKSLDGVFGYINTSFQASSKSVNDSKHRLVLLQVTLKLSASGTVSLASFSQIFDLIWSHLDISSLDQLDIEDFDLDLLLLDNSVREDALVTLNELVKSASYSNIQTKLLQIVEIIKIFSSYNPLDHREEEQDEIDDDIEFSDDDDDENANLDDDDENDGLASRLRFQAVVIVQLLTSSFPQLLSVVYTTFALDLVALLSDTNVHVSTEAINALILVIRSTKQRKLPAQRRMRAASDVSMTSLDEPACQLVDSVLPLLEQKIFQSFTEQTSNAGAIIQLIESLIETVPEAVTDLFVEKVHAKLQQSGLSGSHNIEVLTMYKILLQNLEISKISSEFLDLIVADLTRSINDKLSYHNFITENLLVMTILIAKLSEDSAKKSHLVPVINNELIESLLAKITQRNYSSDLRQAATNSLTEFLVHFDVSEHNIVSLITIFKESLNFEITVNSTLDNLIRIIAVPNTKVFFCNENAIIPTIVEKLQSFILSSDSALYLRSIKLLSLLLETYPDQVNLSQPDYEKLVAALIKIVEDTSDFVLINLSLKVTGEVVAKLGEISLPMWTVFVTSIVNTKLADIEELDLGVFESLVERMVDFHSGSTDELFNMLNTTLDHELSISAKIMAVMVVKLKRSDYVEKAQLLVTAYTQNPVDTTNVGFYIQFLAYVSLAEPTQLSLQDLYAILSINKSEQVNLATSKAIGIFLGKNTKEHMSNLLAKYNDNGSVLLLNSVKEVTKNNRFWQDSNLVDLVWVSLNEVVEKKCTESDQLDNLAELKILGDILSSLIAHDDKYVGVFLNGLHSDSEIRVYVNIVVIKSLIGDSALSCDVQLIKELMTYLQTVNIDIKQAVMSTLLTAFHTLESTFIENLNTEVLPGVFNELSAKEEFKKVIPMGPYKYVMDEGLEIRKLSYELLYTIINFDDEGEQLLHKIDYRSIFYNLVEQGLDDGENDIIILLSMNLINLINKFGLNYFLVARSNYMATVIEKLDKQVNKKIRSKASTQEVESFEEGMRSVIKLSRTINKQLNGTNGDWIQYYVNMKSKHMGLYNE